MREPSEHNLSEQKLVLSQTKLKEMVEEPFTK